MPEGMRAMNMQLKKSDTAVLVPAPAAAAKVLPLRPPRHTSSLDRPPRTRPVRRPASCRRWW